jgi:hypothetical protein
MSSLLFLGGEKQELFSQCLYNYDDQEADDSDDDDRNEPLEEDRVT